eukprot:jgi/Botrbrau1/9290/Bobra.0111s0015.1
MGSYEYLVFLNVFEAIAKKVGLYPVTDYGMPALEACFLKACALSDLHAQDCFIPSMWSCRMFMPLMNDCKSPEGFQQSATGALTATSVTSMQGHMAFWRSNGHMRSQDVM